MRAAYLLVLIAPALAAQTTTTCTPVGTSTICRTSKPPATAAGAVGSIFEGMAQDKANREAREARDAQRRLDSAEAANAAAQGAARNKAQWDLFMPRAVMIIQRGADSLWFRGGHLDSLYWNEASAAAVNLYSVIPLASNQQIADALEPVVGKYRMLVTPFDNASAAILTRTADSLALTGRERSSYFNEAAKPLTAMRESRWMAVDYDIRRAINGIVDSVRISRLIARAAQPSPPTASLD